MKPLAIDLYCGLGGWSEGFLSEGYDVIGFDLERRPYPSQLVLQDVLTLHGSQFKDAEIIVGSSPCQEFSYRAMPFKRCKSLGPPLLGIELFQAQFRIQREASEAAGRQIPMVVENVRGAQPWVGRAAWHYGSYYLWGDVPALMPFTYHKPKAGSLGWSEYAKTGVPSKGFNTTYDQQYRAERDGVKLPNNSSARRWEDRPIPRLNAVNKLPNGEGYTVAVEESASIRTIRQKQQEAEDGIKQGGDWFDDPKSMSRKYSSHSAARKAASAQIAKIPFELARYIASVYKPAQ